MTCNLTISLSPKEASNDKVILHEIKKKFNNLGFEPASFVIVKRSIDARKKNIKVNLTLKVSDDSTGVKEVYKERIYKQVSSDAKQIIIVGSGPAGLFAALKAIELGFKPLVMERGKDVDSRRKDIALISRENKISPDSNFCFGEGGAGTFSDGKLFTRSKKRGNNREVLEILHQFGANQDILVNSHPHIGSDKLPLIIKKIREKIIECGGEVRFECKMTDILLKDNEAIGVVTEKGERLMGPVFLATGHSARDIYRLLNNKNIQLQSKPLAIGVRLEHPQILIDKIQYHSENGRGEYLPPAEYSFVTQIDNRGVYTFCMCPGGVIVPAVSNEKQIVVNGMSASSRSGRWANSGYVVEVHPGDIPDFGIEDNLSMLKLQEHLENKFSEESKGTLNAPAQRISDFIEGVKSEDLPSSSYVPGIHVADFNELLPLQISSRLKAGLKEIGRKCPAFLSSDAILVGLESRTSSPIRIPRDPEKLHHLQIKNLYPIGEGAGYAGGIVSSAIDGIRCVEAYNFT